jgi:hypothetical protein
MVLEFTIHIDKFLEMGGMFLTFFGLLWGVSYTLKTARTY